MEPSLTLKHAFLLILVEDCADLVVTLNDKVLTNVIELWKCKNVTVNVRKSRFLSPDSRIRHVEQKITFMTFILTPRLYEFFFYRLVPPSILFRSIFAPTSSLSLRRRMITIKSSGPALRTWRSSSTAPLNTTWSLVSSK